MNKHNGVLIMDLETSGLNANRGHIMCAAAKWYGKNQKMMTFRIDDTPGYGRTPKSWFDDSVIVKELVELATSANAVVAFYGGYGKFDLPYLNTRALAHGLQPCPQISVVDPYTTAKGKLKLERNGLASVAEAINAKEKYHLPWDDWQLAKYGDRKAMNKILKYCINDIHCLEDVYNKLLPLMNTHPYVADPTGLNKEHRVRQCPVCGSLRTRSMGSRNTKYYKIMRRQCKETNCRHNFQSGKVKI